MILALLINLLLVCIQTSQAANVGHTDSENPVAHAKFEVEENLIEILNSMNLVSGKMTCDQQSEELLQNDSSSDLNAHYQQFVGTIDEFDVSKQVHFKMYTEGPMMRPKTPLAYFALVSTDERYMSYSLPIVDYLLIYMVKFYFLYLARKIAGERICHSDSFVQKLILGAKAISDAKDKLEDSTENHNKLYINFGPALDYAKEYTKQRKLTKLLNFISSIMTNFVIGLLVLVCIAWYAVYNSSANGSDLVAESKPESLSSIVDSRMSRILKSDAVAKFSTIEQLPADFVADSAESLETQLRNFCSLGFVDDLIVNFGNEYALSSLIDSSAVDSYRNVEIRENADSLMEDLSKILKDYDAIYDWHLKLKSQFYQVDEKSQFVMELDGKYPDIRQKLPYQVVNAKKVVKEFKLPAKEEFVSMFEQLNLFSSKIATNLVPKYDKLVKACEDQISNNFFDVDDIYDMALNRYYIVKDSIEDILEKIRHVTNFPYDEIDYTSGLILRSVYKDLGMMHGSVAAVFVVIVLLTVLGFIGNYAVPCLTKVPFIRDKFNAMLAEHIGGITTVTLSFFDWIVGPCFRFYLIGAMVLAHQMYLHDYVLWETVFSSDGDILVNVKTSETIQDILDSGDETPFKDHTFAALTEHCTKQGTFPIDWDEYNLLKIYKHKLTQQVDDKFQQPKSSHDAQANVKNGDTATKPLPAPFVDKNDAKLIQEIGKLNIFALASGQQKNTLEEAFKMFPELYDSLLIMSKLSEEQGYLLFSSTEYDDAQVNLYKLLYFAERMSRIATRLTSSQSYWNVYYEMSVARKMPVDFLNMRQHIDSTILSEVAKHSHELNHELTHFTFECKSITSEIQRIASGLSNILRSMFSILDTINGFAKMLCTAHIFLIVSMLLRNGICTAPLITATEPMRVSTMKEMTFAV